MLLSCIRLGITIIVVMLFHWYVMNNKSVFMCHVCIRRGVITINLHCNLLQDQQMDKWLNLEAAKVRLYSVQV